MNTSKRVSVHRGSSELAGKTDEQGLCGQLQGPNTNLLQSAHTLRIIHNVAGKGLICLSRCQQLRLQDRG